MHKVKNDKGKVEDRCVIKLYVRGWLHEKEMRFLQRFRDTAFFNANQRSNNGTLEKPETKLEDGNGLQAWFSSYEEGKDKVDADREQGMAGAYELKRQLSAGWEHLEADPLAVNGLELRNAHIKALKLAGLSRCCQLQGTLPKLSGMVYLVCLDLAGNRLHGPIPPSIGQCELLTMLRLEKNELEGSIPESLCECSYLCNIVLDHNRLSGLLPQGLGMLSQLKTLRAKHNQLCGAIPDSLGQCTELKLIDLSHNQLTGKWPGSMGDLRALQHCDMSNNSMFGFIPTSMQKCSDLRSLDMYENQFEDTESTQKLLREQIGDQCHMKFDTPEAEVSAETNKYHDFQSNLPAAAR